MVDQIIDRAVTADEDDLILLVQPLKERCVIDLCHIDRLHTRNIRFYTVVGQRIEKIIFHQIASLSLQNQSQHYE